MTSSHSTPAPCQWFDRLAAALDRRSAPRLALLFLGAILARGRRTVTTWIRAAKLSGQYQRCYVAVAAAGKRADRIARRLLTDVVRPLLKGATRLTLALDDTPTQRYGPHVQGAGLHHNPTPGPAGSPYVYGHVVVVLGLLVTQKAWGTIALPLLARLYVRKKDLPAIDPKHRPEFRTKLELTVEMLRWAGPWLGLLKLPIWVVADGAYAKKDFLKPAMSLGMTVEPTPQGRGPADTARAQAAGATRPGPDLRPGRDRPGQAGRPAAGLVLRHVRVVRGEGGQAIQDIPGDLEAGRGADPGGAGGRADRLEGILLHRHRGECRRHPDDDRRPLQPGDHLSRLQGDRWSRPAAGAVHLGEHRCVPRLPVDVHDDRGVGLGPDGRGVGGPLGFAVGQPVPASEPRGQAAGVAS